MIKQYLYYFIKKSSEKSHRKYYSQYYSREIEEYKNCKEKKSSFLIKKEMKALKKYWNVYPFQYFRYRLYHKDCQLTLQEMQEYIPDYFAYYIFYPQSFKERNILCEDKNLFSAICRGYNINQPKLLYAISKGLINDINGNSITISEMLINLKCNNNENLFFKPTYGVGGKGIIIFIKKNNSYFSTHDNSEISEEFIRSILSYDYIIQDGLIADDITKSIYPYAINTFRIVTHCHNNNVEVLFAILRLGQGGKHVDNASSGGMYIKVDIKNGTLDNNAVSFAGKKYTQHPDTGFIFSNYQLPFWNEILTFAKHIALCFKEFEYMGWDIAYTNQGPAIIEANNGPGVSILQDCYGGIKSHFNIENPNQYWYSDNYALKDL